MPLRQALAEVYGRPVYRLSALAIAATSAALLAWSGQVITLFAQGGIFVNGDVWALASLALVATLLGLTLPLHWFAWRRSRRAAPASGIGLLGAVFSVGSLSCCAPLLLPGLLSLLGFSGSSLLVLNVHLHQWRIPLTLLAVAFLAVSLWMAATNVARSCALPGRSLGPPGAGLPAA